MNVFLLMTIVAFLLHKKAAAIILFFLFLYSKNKFMLDQPQYEQQEPKQMLKCEVCGLKYSDDENWQSIDEHGVCLDCNE